MKELHIENLLFLGLCSGLAFLFALWVYPFFIRWVQDLKLTQKIRTEDVTGKASPMFTKLHAHKCGTPTMGGVVMLVAIGVTVLLTWVLSKTGVISSGILNVQENWLPTGLLSRGETYLPIFTLFAVGVLGVIDDYLNITEKSAQKGLSARVKLWTLIAFGVLAAWWFTMKLGRDTVHISGWGDLAIGVAGYAALTVFTVVGTANAVNFTDGLDGLAGGLLAIAYAVFGAIAYFKVQPILAAFCFVIVAVLVAFLWFNVPPAKIYMGDTGSLALGATLGVIALMTDSLVILALVGGIFILETISIVLQLFWKKFLKRKLFLIAPLHHHFEAKGWSETQIVMRFWILGAIAGAAGLLLGVLGAGANALIL